MPRVLVILPTSTYRASDFVEAAEALGVELAIASEERPPLGMEDRFVQIDCSLPHDSAERLADLASSTPVDAIIPADDAGVVIAALASERLGLPHNPPPAAAATRNKAMLRRGLATREIPQPRFRIMGSADPPGAVAGELGYPVVIKPLSLQGSRGVIRADDAGSAERAAERIRRILASAGSNPNEPLLVEEFIPGPEVAVEGMLWNGELEVLGVFDKPDPLDGPYFEETIYVTPSRLHPEILDEVLATTGRAAAALGLAQGPIHAELRVTDGNVLVIELAARTIGGLCGRSLRFGLMGTSLEVLVLRQALGMRRRGLRREQDASGVMMLPIPAAGTLHAVRGQDRALAVPGIIDLELTMTIGSQLVPLPEGDRYLGFLFARAATPEEVEESLRAAHAELSFEIA